MKYHYHVLHEHVHGSMEAGSHGAWKLGSYYLTANVDDVTTTKQKAWNIAQEVLRNDREAGRKVRKVGKQKWYVDDTHLYSPNLDSTDYICEITTCYETDCGFLDT